MGYACLTKHNIYVNAVSGEQSSNDRNMVAFSKNKAVYLYTARKMNNVCTYMKLVYVLYNDGVQNRITPNLDIVLTKKSTQHT